MCKSLGRAEFIERKEGIALAMEVGVLPHVSDKRRTLHHILLHVLFDQEKPAQGGPVLDMTMELSAFFPSGVQLLKSS